MTHIYGIDERGFELVGAATKIAEEIKEQATEVDQNAVFPQAAINKLAELRRVLGED